MALTVEIRKKLDAFLLDVSFEAGEEVFAVLGESGCGKSMTLKCIAGIETPDEGKIILNGRTLFDSEKKINLPPGKRNVGFLFQDYALFPNLTVAENIGIAIPGKYRKEKTRQYAEQFFLEELMDSYPDHLSGGQKQRTAFARMMAAEPEILLLDEPFSAVDNYLGWRLERQLVRMLERFQKTVLFVSHDRDEVYRFSDRMGIIYRGHMERIGTKQEIFSHPGTRAAALLTGCKNIGRLALGRAGIWECPDWGIQVSVQVEEPGQEWVLGVHEADILLRDAGMALQGTEETEADRMEAEVALVMEDPGKWIYGLSPLTGTKELWAEAEKGAGPPFLTGQHVQVFIPREKWMVLCP